MAEVINLDNVRQVAELQRSREALRSVAASTLEGGEDGPKSPDMSVAERLAKVEAAIDGLRHAQTLTIGATLGAAALLAGFVVAFGVYSLQRIDAVDNKLDAKFDTLTTRMTDEAARTRQDLIGIATAISNSITATRQPAPPVIVIPPSQPPPEQPKR
jgi:hypothetical protein